MPRHVSTPSSPADAGPALQSGAVLLVFDARNRLLVPSGDGPLRPTLEVKAPGAAADVLSSRWRDVTGVSVNPVSLASPGGEDAEAPLELFGALLGEDEAIPAGYTPLTIGGLLARRREDPGAFSLRLAHALDRLPGFITRIPYLNLGDNDYIYRFRTNRQRNWRVYSRDDSARSLYRSPLIEAVKLVKRVRERSSTRPAVLDFGPVRYSLPSHFGFCLGVQNAIERAYETLAENPGRRVFMLSELIHNPFVNDDLRRRGLLYLQTDKGVPIDDPVAGRPYWDSVGEEDVVIIPAFGATDEDKRRLIERGIAIRRHDATCMLVEKVWKAARRFGQEGYTVVIHGKHEHEETKATFSNSTRNAPSIVVRDLAEARRLGEVILAHGPAERRRLFEPFADRCSPGFDPDRDLVRLAVVNQTTLLRNETLGIIAHLEAVMEQRYGRETLAHHLNGKSRGDTLCYATQVNQDALEKALADPLDAALVVGGKNSSNTFQLFRMCAERLGDRAFYIQSEDNLLSLERVRHYHFPHASGDSPGGHLEERPFLPDRRPLHLLVTGGASCPDGIIHRVIHRINGFFPPRDIRPTEALLAELEAPD
ncbi:MAG: 4-hydroxy-3-methylbut-2-enyl diphosphate reductase [Puniceicoccaceae bacterium]|nr:MAG: 4-hydroxy-3-methylbut-2-enyl diphosphate reductase [Puniceicoccaceae bacterium]